MVDVYVYEVDIHGKVSEAVVPCIDGYTVYINRNLPRNRRISALEHAVRHILRGDFEKPDAGKIEEENHAQITERIRYDLSALRITEKTVDSSETGWQGS